jgi:hypothetical protein
MILVVESDAFYLCEPKSRSRAGGYHYMGNRSDLDKRPDTVNGAIDCISCIIKSVVSSVAVAEYAALFLNGEIAMGLRKTLADLNYPQPATPIACDNAVAVGISKHSQTAQDQGHRNAFRLDSRPRRRRRIHSQVVRRSAQPR